MRSYCSLILTAAAASALCSCAGSDIVAPGGSLLRVVNSTTASVTVSIDDAKIFDGVPAGAVTGLLSMPAGGHRLRVTSSAGTSEVIVAVAVGKVLVAAALPTANGITATSLLDTGSAVPAGKSKLRVVHLSAAAGNIEIWRTQPDYQTPIHIMTPFNYKDESPFLQSNAGSWEVFITPAGSPTKLVSTGAVSIPSGERRTAVLMDSLGVRIFRVLPE